MKHYDYIFAGGGLSALMTVYKMVQDDFYSDKKILIIDPDTKQQNDRTWCFWHKGGSAWEKLIHRKWNTALVKDTGFSKKLDFSGYSYNMVRGIDFYAFIHNTIKNHPNVEDLHEKVLSFKDRGSDVTVKTENSTYTCNTLFNSIYHPEIAKSQNKYPVLQQHFIGWHVKTEHPVFDTQTPVFMDFSIPQQGNTRFMYVLPFSENEALVEYTLFSKDLLPVADYEAAIKNYLKNLSSGSYDILDREFGSIPMTCYPFWEHNTENIMHIGSAGGWTKASTGYTFRNSDKLSGRLVTYLKSGNTLKKFCKKNHFWFYDLLLLDILAEKNYAGHRIFSAMFRNGDAATVFKFLDEETNVAEDLKVISRCPKGLFIKALQKRFI